MILTITMNPSVDISYPLDHLAINTVNRVSNTIKTAGGKGLNVTRVLKDMGNDPITSGVLGGHLGKFIIDALDQQGIKNDFYQIDQETRNCIAILHDNGQQTEILESGPVLNHNIETDFLDFFEAKLLSYPIEVITVSGSLPQGIPSNFYSKLIKISSKKNIPLILDTSGNSLKESVFNLQSEKPFLIKPNEEEIIALTGKGIDNSDIYALKEALMASDLSEIEWIVVSLGADGCIAKHKDKFYKVNIPSISVVNPVGSGDATIAGFALAISQSASDEDILKTGMTTGMLNTQEKLTGHVNPKNFQELFQKVTVELF
ncbi:hexose kinase [Aerococcaceae bacterium DSM 111020]|nr:hexose kinase [Aerococcaceae bacterium DSM 111020]